MEEATEAIDMLLSDDDIKGAWSHLKAWYKHAGDQPSAPSCANLQSALDEYCNLYSQEAPPGA